MSKSTQGTPAQAQTPPQQTAVQAPTQDAAAQQGMLSQQLLGNEEVAARIELTNMKVEANQVVSNWYTETTSLVDRDAAAQKGAGSRMIEFDESGTAQFATMAGVAGAALALPTFGSSGAVIGFAVGLLGTAAGASGGASGKIAALTSACEENRNKAGQEAKQHVLAGQAAINAARSKEDLERARKESIATLPAAVEVRENIIYRDMLLLRADAGGNNLSGSQWNVDNMSVFGKAEWYQSWDWGSPGWTNGQDIAGELNDLAESDPSTRTDVRINALGGTP